jgi:hypothetical protein
MRLLASVEGPDPDRDEAWSAELDRRDAEFDSGGVVGIRRLRFMRAPEPVARRR